MLPESPKRWVVIGMVVIMGISLFSVPIVASVTINTDSSYGGVDSNNQTIAATVEITPDDTQIDDVEVNVEATDNGVLDFRTFSEALEPARADADVEYMGEGRYTVSQVNTDERFIITFDVYPKTIREKNLTVATVSIEYTQRGQRLSETREITANLSNSEYFALQDSQDKVSNLENKLRNRRWLTYASIAVLVLIPLLIVLRRLETGFGSSGGEDSGSSGGGGDGGGRFDD